MRVNLLNIIYNKGISLSSLSKVVGCSYSNLSNLAHNRTKSIQFDLLEKLCRVLDCEISELLVLEDEVGE